ncbi:hypothetical protein ACFLQ0_01445 [Nitrospinota bacterium]
MNNPHIVVDISGHGFGHAAQVGPILNQLRKIHPSLKITIRSKVPAEHFRRIIEGPFFSAFTPADPCLSMLNPIDVDNKRTFSSYKRIHGNWHATITREKEKLDRLEPDLLLSDVAYSSLTAASELGVPCVALSSLTWVDTFQFYCGLFPDVSDIHSQAISAYNSANLFMQVSPHCPMEYLSNTQEIGPVASLGRKHRGDLTVPNHLSDSDRLVLVNFGGISVNAHKLVSLPEIAGVKWILPNDWPERRPDILTEQIHLMPFLDLICSCDAVVTKTGYGIFTEAVCNGTRVLYAPRPEWPEATFLEKWLTLNGTAMPVPRETLETGKFAQALEQLLKTPTKPPLSPDGIQEAVHILKDFLP